MRTIGLVGGMSWYSTVEYYTVINSLVQERLGGHASARVALHSLDFAEVRACQLSGDWDGAAALLSEAAHRCELGGADLVLICTNLMHRVAGPVAEAIDVPLVHIADAIAARAQQQGWRTLGLLGTRWVMEEDFYVGRLREHGLEVLIPDAADRAEVDRVIFDELTQGVVEPASRTAFARVAAELAGRGAEAVVLACTEIELLLRPEDVTVPLIDSMRAHAEAAVTLALRDSASLPA